MVSLCNKIYNLIVNKKILYDVEAILLLFFPILVILDRNVQLVGTILTGVPFVIGILSVIIYQKNKRFKYFIIGILLVLNYLLTCFVSEQFEYIKPLLIFITTFDMVQDVDFLKTIKWYFEKYYKFLVFSIGLVLLVNIIYIVIGKANSNYSEVWNISAFEGIFYDPHQAAYRLCVIILYIMFLIKAKGESKILNILNIFYLVITEYLILKTGARIPTLLGLALCMIAIYFMRNKIISLFKKHKVIYTSIIVLIIVGIAIYLPQTSFMKKNFESAKGTFDNGRTILRNVGLEYYGTSNILNKLFGTDIYNIYFINRDAIHGIFTWSHNDCVQILLQFGILMLGVYIFTFIRAMLYNLKAQKKFDKFIIILLYAVLFFVGFFNGLFYHPRFVVAIPVLFTIYKLYNTSEKESAKDKGKKTTKTIKVLNLLASANTGGIESLIKDIMEDNSIDNRMCTLFDEGKIFDEISKRSPDKIFSLKNLNRNKKRIVEKIEEYCIDQDIDIITIHNGGISCNYIYYSLKERLPHLKYVRYFHSSFDEYWEGRGNTLKNFIIKVAMQKAINSSDLLVFISKAVEQTFLNNFRINKNKCKVVYNGINNNYINKEQNISDERMNEIIYVGRLEYEKGVHLLVDAFEEVSKEIPNTKLTVVGDGTEKTKLLKKVEKLNLKDKITFTGRQDNVIEWLDKSEIFVYPSIWEEGFGISVIEAMSRGCIPITFNRGGLPEIISDGKNGFLVKEVKADNLAKKIIEVLKLDKSKKQELINNAKDRASDFKIESTVRNLKEAYEKL